MTTAQKAFDFDPPAAPVLARAREFDRPGSTEAARKKNIGNRAGSAAYRILEYLSRQAEPLTSKQIGERMGLDRHEAGKRCSDLLNAGKVKCVGYAADDGKEMLLEVVR